MFDFTDSVVLVTGASGNLGQATARAFAATHAKLALVGRDAARVRQALPHLTVSDNTLVLPMDMRVPEAVQDGVQHIQQHFGRIDVLVNTVGGYKAGTPVHETPLETWDTMLTLNARTAFLISRAVVPGMLEQGRGKIVHVAARAGLNGSRKAAAYSAAKSAVIRLTESMSAELKHARLNVNCVLPGIIDTPENRAAMPNANFARWVPSKAIADIILFLTSEAAWPIHGAAIPVYGQS